MKQGFRYLILLAFMFLLSNCEKKTQNILYDSGYKKEITEVRKEASLYLVLNNIPGATFAIAKEGKIIYSEGMGLASKDLEVPVTRKTKFRIGDVSEVFTSLVYQMLVEEGTLSPDSTVQHYFPDYPESVYKGSFNKITLNQLVNHSSGMYAASEHEQISSGANISLQKSIDNFKNEPLESVPGYFQSPSANNYNLLGAIMEKVTGKKFAVLLKEYITDTLKLSNTEVDNPFATVIGRSDCFDFNLVSQVVKTSFIDLRNQAPSDGILSNAEDLVKFGNAILYSEVITNSLKEKLFAYPVLLGDFPPSIANGWVVQKNANGELYYGKVGGVTGGGSILLIIPDQKLVIAGAVNLTSSDEIPVFKMLQPFLPKTEADSK